MADQGKWFKLWESSLDDGDLENLSVHQWFCWVRFGVYLKKHGKDGKIRIRHPGTALINLFRVPLFNDAINVLRSLPNYEIEEGKTVTQEVTVENVTFTVTCKNWRKYQGDFSRYRMRKHRGNVTAKVTVQEEKRRDVEEKRREERKDNTMAQAPKRAIFSKPSLAEITAYAKSIAVNIDPVKFLDHYESNGWRVGKNPMRDWKATVRKWSRSEFNTEEPKNGTNDSTGAIDYAAFARAKREAEKIRTDAAAGEVPSGV